MRPFKPFLAILAAILIFNNALTFVVWAQGDDNQPTFVRDAEIENYLRALATPIYRAAEIEPTSVSINIVQSSVVNAFVADGMNQFFYTGLLQLTDTPEQLAGVIAHETGHIAGGHLIRGKEEMANASAQAILGMILAVAAGAATGNGQLAAGALSGSQQIAERGFLSFSRTVEASADNAGMSFLEKAGMSANGMLEFFQKLAGEEMLPQSSQDAYVRTHPLTQDRIENVKNRLENSANKDTKLVAKYYTMHERMKAKLLGYLQPETALLRYTDNDTRIPPRYARALALYRTGKADRAIAVTDTLIHEEPNNPFFYELKGQIQFENGKIDESIANYKHANELLPDSALLRTAYGHALLESKNPNHIDIAIQNLLEANHIEGRDPTVWRFLAAAWGRKAEITKDTQYQGMATYALAEEAVAAGHDKAAGQLADRAMKVLKKGSTYWLRAQDIKLSTAPADDKDKHDDKKNK
jgi:predicted Zn-dependent protease